LVLGKLRKENEEVIVNYRDFQKSSDLETKIKTRLQEIVQIVPPQEGEELEL
jgi:hypothetical protein